jgi:hypothetical protein
LVIYEGVKGGGVTYKGMVEVSLYLRLLLFANLVYSSSLQKEAIVRYVVKDCWTENIIINSVIPTT